MSFLSFVRPAARRALRGSSWPALAPAAVAVIGVTAASSRALQPGEQAYPVALHVHGSMSEGLGSMEWHADRAVQTGVVDVIWWTDHDWRMEHWSHTKRFDFETATIDGNFKVTEPDDAYGGEFRFWEPRDVTAGSWVVSLVDSTVFEGSKSMRLEASTALTGSFVGFSLAQTASRIHNRYSLAKRVHLHLAVHPAQVNNQSKFIVEVRLSDHPSQAHVLRYVMGSMVGEAASTIALPFNDDQWNSFDLDVTGDAISQFTVGGIDTLRAEDNDLFEVTIRVETKHSSVTPLVFIDDYRIESDDTITGQQLMDKSREIAALYETTYPPVSHFVGTEISRYRAQNHLNAYAPNLTLPDYTGTVFSDSIYWAVDQIHDQDGAVAMNHVFGTGVYGNPAETPQQKAGRIRFWKRAMIASRVYDCDLFEVGYRERGGIDLAGYLDTWDAITGNTIFVTANGVSDSHGTNFLDGWGPWQPGNDLFENNFVTWLFSPQLDEAGLISAMKSGRAFFGDPFVFDPAGSLDLCTAEGFPMGRVVLTDQGAHDVYLEIDGLPATSTVRLLQGEIRENPPVEYLDVNYLRDETLTGTWAGTVFTDTVTVDTTVPSFVRVEVDDQGTATAYSNYLALVRDAPAQGILGPRVAASIGGVHIRGADEFTLTDAVLTAGSPVTRFVVTGDEETPGLGTLEIAPGALGEPDGVLGGGFTSYQYQNGLLTLVGFSGTGSTVELLWGATGVNAEPRPIDRLSLGTGHPNPFGNGTVAELALPRAGTVFLEVLDVSGRRIRLLLDERLERGMHRVEWDGRDSYGRPVANGVYFLRVTTMGETLTTKAVRIR